MARSKKTSSRSARDHPAARWNTIPGYDAIATAGNCVFDEKAANHVIRFIESACKLTTSTWAGQPFVLLPWQKAVIANAYGWLRPDGTRRYRRVHILVPRKCGKTELGACLRWITSSVYLTPLPL